MFIDTLSSHLIGPTPSILILVPAVIFLLWITWAVYACYLHPYADIPGPFWAKVSRLWLVAHVLRGDIHKTQNELHKRYGHLVRIAPNEVSVSDPTALKTIYGIKSASTKTDFYTPFAPHLSPNEDLFTQRDEKIHAHQRRFVNNLYSLSSVLGSEKYVDSCTNMFMSRIDEFATSGSVMDLGMWLQMYAFDVIGELFYGSQFGFMENRHDYENYIESLDTLLPAIATACVLPSYMRPLQVLGHLIPPLHRALASYDKIVLAAKCAVSDRQKHMEAGGVGRSDILDKLFNTSTEKSGFTVADITTEAWVSLFAGSDTTAIALRSVLYHLMKHPDTYKKLTEEIDAAANAGKLSDPITYSEAMELPYLVACCKEGLRVHPSVGMSLPRHVPPSGITIAGRFFPGGSRVGMSANVIHSSQEIFGKDAETWNPDRWFQPDRDVMDRHMLHFGAGSRTCVGKNISLTEIHKLVPNILRHYRLELAHPERPLKTINFWFHKQLGLEVKVTKR